MKLTTKILISIALISLSFGAGYYATPTKIETKTIVKIETVKVEGKTKIVYREKITQPDGTVTERESEREDTNTREESKSLSQSEKIIINDSGLVLSGLGYINTKDLTNGIDYGIVISKRVLGALNSTGSVIVEKNNVKIGLGVGWSF